MKKMLFLLFHLLLLMAESSCHRQFPNDALTYRIDSLNALSYGLRYKDLSLSTEFAEQAYMLTSMHGQDDAATLNNMGFCSFMKMDFEKSMEYFNTVVEISDNEIECLIADVGLMKICQRISSNKEFYDYRSRAQSRIKRIKQDRVVESDLKLSARFNYALSEFHIASGVYFYYLQQEKESLAEIDAIDMDKIEADTAQMLYYMYMRGSGGMYSASTPEEVIIGEFGYLLDCLTISEENGYVYFEANALQGMAEILNFKSNRTLIAEKRKGWLEAINENDCPIDSLPLHIAERSMKLFKDYGDWYQISGAYRTKASYYNHIGMPEKAFPLLDTALQYVNKHHEKYYACTDTADRLKTYSKGLPYSLELKWINQDGIKTVPEWIARLREQLSLTYSAMGMKTQSDYNRNIYLDILDYTRQDKELESRYAVLDKESYLLNVLLMMVVLGFFILATALVLLNRFWRIRNNQYIDKLNKVLLVCRNITAAVPVEASEQEQVVRMVEKAVRLDVLSITGSDELWIELAHSDNECDAPQWISDEKKSNVLDLIAPGKNESVGRLWLKKSEKLKHDEMSMMGLITPYMAWTLENGLNLMMLADARIRLEQEEYIHRMHIADNKRQNEIKKTCVAIVNGIVPYIDRVINEIAKLRNAPYAKDKNIRDGKLQYIDELLSKINDYNEILDVWIKMKQGEISLNIESFDLDSLFTVIAKSRHSFDMKRQRLNVEKCGLLVRADKALTLFMINTLTDNARKYTQEGGLIRLSACEKENYVEISIEDNGPGLSEPDVKRILNEKVYDSGKIGIDTAPDTEKLVNQKGNGFGLMNCKGIMEKYKKTSPLFGVCMLGVDSEPKRGSRFYFRLPKGIRKSLYVAIGFILFIRMFSFPVNASSVVKADTVGLKEEYVVTGYDSLLSIANMYADMVYESNVEGDYSEAMVLADSAFHYLNLHYLKYSGSKGPVLDADSRGSTPELVWLEKKFDTDYYIILDVRNEVAVASLAMKNFTKYYYNNRAYTVLYKLISEDKSLEQYCQDMQKSASNKIVAIMLFVVLIAVGIVAYYVLYLRHMLHSRYNIEQVFTINQTAFSVSGNTDVNSSEICSGMVNSIFRDINELIAIDNIVIGISDGDEGKLDFSWYFDCDDEILVDRLNRSYINRRIMYDDENKWTVLPLRVDSPDEVKYIGVLGLRCEDKLLSEEDMVLLELVSEYLGVALYNTIVQVERRFKDIEIAKDDISRAEHEESVLHVQNMVLDNCLSTIKHETIYYPGRLRKIIERVRDDYKACHGSQDMDKSLKDMDELVVYYKEIFTLLSSCASRTLDGVTFKRSSIIASEILSYSVRYYNKLIRRMETCPLFNVDIREECRVTGDEILLRFLFENLIDESLRYKGEGEITLTVATDEGFARFEFTDNRRDFSQDELNLIFYPDNAKVETSENGKVLSGAEFLICKQIIRDHDEFGGRRGCRINANVAKEGRGLCVWFTLPLKRGVL